MKIGVKSSSNLLWRLVLLPFQIIIRLIKSRHEEVKSANLTRAYAMVAIDANLIGCKNPKGVSTIKQSDLIADIFSINRVGVLVCTDHPKERYDTKKENIRRKLEK